MRINEIFYSLQGEGCHTGTPAVFVRFSGCNLQCPFCDTRHQTYTTLTEAQVVDQVLQYPARLVVLTGGEPSLQLTPSLVDALHAASRYVAVETNGTHPLPPGIDWITLSPKNNWFDNADTILTEVDELKLLFDANHEPDAYPHIHVRHARLLQPCDVGDPHANALIVSQTIDYIKTHPQWRLSLQTHKILNIQ